MELRVLYKGKITDTDNTRINKKVVITEENFEAFDYIKQQETWASLKLEMGIESAYQDYEREKTRVVRR